MNTTTISQFAAFTFSLAVATLAACNAEEPADPDSDNGINPLLSCVDQDFAVARPLESELYKPAEGGLVSPTQDSYVVHTTQIVVPTESEGDFFSAMAPVVTELDKTPGLIAYSLSGDAGCGDYRTLGIWESEEAMYAFVGSEAHAQAMAQTNTVSETGRVVHWKATVAEVNTLSWDTAKAKISSVSELPSY